jgi:hypothetical protein
MNCPSLVDSAADVARIAHVRSTKYKSRILRLVDIKREHLLEFS